MSKKIFILSMFALTILLCGCGNSSKNNAREIDLGYELTQGENNIGVDESNKNFIDNEVNNDNVITQGTQDRGTVDNFSDEAL